MVENIERKRPEIVEYERPERPADVRPAANVFELLDRILDKGLVIIGDIRINVADIELIKLQIRLLIASVETAKKMGIDFSWAKMPEEPKTKLELQKRIKELEAKLGEGEEKTPEEREAVTEDEIETKTETAETGGETESKETSESF